MGATGSRRRGSTGAGPYLMADAGEERKTSVPQPRRARRAGPLDAGPFAADIASFRLHPAAENKTVATIRTYAGAACWFAACHLLAEAGKTRREQVEAADVRRWMVWLLGRHSDTYACQQAAVRGHPVEPRPDRGTLLEAAEPLPGGQRGFLQRILPRRERTRGCDSSAATSHVPIGADPARDANWAVPGRPVSGPAGF
jgi:hypothetical protein